MQGQSVGQGAAALHALHMSVSTSRSFLLSVSLGGFVHRLRHGHTGVQERGHLPRRSA